MQALPVINSSDKRFVYLIVSAICYNNGIVAVLKDCLGVEVVDPQPPVSSALLKISRDICHLLSISDEVQDPFSIILYILQHLPRICQQRRSFGKRALVKLHNLARYV